MSARKRCDWCGVFVKADQPAFTWCRTFGPSGFVDGVWTRIGPDHGWTKPQVLCPDCAESASYWPRRHMEIFAEVDP